MLLFLAVLGVLLFGDRLPEVARSFGKGLMEFKKGVRGIEEQIRSAMDPASSEAWRADDAPYAGKHTRGADDEPEEREEATSPKFEPPERS